MLARQNNYNYHYTSFKINSVSLLLLKQVDPALVDMSALVYGTH